MAHQPSVTVEDMVGARSGAGSARPEAAAAAPAPQDPQPRHIDQQAPPRRRTVRDPRVPYSAHLGVGLGELSVHSRGTRFDDSVPVATLTGVVESGDGIHFGPGVRLELQRSGDSLFADELMNDGQQVRHADARVDAIDCNPYMVWRPEVGDDLALPVRMGIFVDSTRLQHRASEVRRTWFSYGARVECEPTWTFERDGDVRWDLVGLLGVDLGGARFRETYVGGSDDDHVLRWMGEAGLGVRLTKGNFTGQIDYRFRDIEFGATSTALLGDDRRSDIRSSMLFLQAGVRF